MREIDYTAVERATIRLVTPERPASVQPPYAEYAERIRKVLEQTKGKGAA